MTSKVADRVLALSIGLVLAGGLFGSAVVAFPASRVGQVWRSARDHLWPGPAILLGRRCPARSERILAELEQLAEHPWAGVYRTRGRFPLELSISPDAGFTIYNEASCGTCAGWRSTGTVLSSSDSELALHVEVARESPGDWTALWSLDARLHLVPWGELLFALPANQMAEFCAQAADVEAESVPLAFYRYTGDDVDFDSDYPVRPPGLPAVPAEYRHLLE